MSVERSEVSFDVDDNRARHAAGNILRDLERVKREAQDTKREVDAAHSGHRSLTTRFNRLLDRAKAKGLRMGEGEMIFGDAIKFGAQGFALREAYRQGMPGMRGAAVGTAVAYGLGYMGERGSDFLENYLDEGRTAADYLRGLPGGTADAMVTKNPLNPAGRFLYQLFTGSPGSYGRRGEVWDTAVDLGGAALSGRESNVDSAIAQQARARKEFMAAFGKEDAMLAKMKADQERKVQDALDAAMERVDRELAKKLEGIRVTKLPIRVSDAMFNQMMEMQREASRRRADEKRLALAQGVGA